MTSYSSVKTLNPSHRELVGKAADVLIAATLGKPIIRVKAMFNNEWH